MCKINNQEIDVKETDWICDDFYRDIEEVIKESNKDKDLEKILSSLADK